jgi:hypothetical protein
MSPLVSAKADTLAAESVRAANAGAKSFTNFSIQLFAKTDNALETAAR